jgi:drug/metabolite transporter (DMT)-like permease
VSVTDARARLTRAEPDWPGYAAFAGASLIWGSTFLFIAYSNEVVAPLWGAALRLGLATVLLSAVALATRAAFPRGRRLRDASLYGLLQFGGNLGLLYWGEQTVPSGITAVVFATAPLQAAIWGRVLGVEAIDRVKLAAALLGLLGVAIIFAGQLNVGVPVPGLIAVFLAASAAVFSNYLLKRIGPISPFAVNAVGAPIGAATLLVASVVLGETRALPQTLGGWWPILYLTIFGSLGAFVLFAWLIGRWSVTTTNFIGVIVPVIALILGAVFRGEQPPLVSYLGAALVLAAVVTALGRSRASAH